MLGVLFIENFTGFINRIEYTNKLLISSILTILIQLTGAKMDTIKVYSASELKEQFPEGFEKAYKNWQDHQAGDIFWSDEIMDSLKAIFKVSDINLINWSIGMDSESWVRFEMPEDDEWDNLIENYTGQKAYNWIKENVLDGAKFKRVTYNNKDGGKGWRYDITKVNGQPWSCEFTGYCADHDFIESLLDDVRTGSTLSDAFHGLADCAMRLLEQESEDQNSEDYFLDFADANDFQFTEDGLMI